MAELQLTSYNSEVSCAAAISASIIQGSSIGPAAYAVVAVDLTTTCAGNVLVMYADDTYLVVPSANASTRVRELDNIRVWEGRNNLLLNFAKTKEIVFRDTRRRPATALPLTDIERVDALKVLGVTLKSHLSASDHIRQVIRDSAQLLYALRVLRHHGLSAAGLHVCMWTN